MYTSIRPQDIGRIIDAEKRIIQAQSDTIKNTCCPYWRNVSLNDADKRVMQAESDLRVAQIRCCCDKKRRSYCGCQR